MASPETLVVNDYAGHPFQVELSDELAIQGHRVVHAYCSTNVTPRGNFDGRSPNLTIETISTGDEFEKYDVRRRLVAEIRYGLGSVKVLRRHGATVCLNSNMPIISLFIITVACRLLRIRPVLWLQDLQAGLIALALGSETHPVVRLMSAIERWCVRNASHVVTISAGFEDAVEGFGVKRERLTTIPNWAPLDDVPVLAQDNPWSREHNLQTGPPVLLYSGSMGIKHRPSALVSLAEELAESQPDAVIVVVSEGVGTEWLVEQCAKRAINNIRFLPFQPFDRLPEVLASADVLVTLLEPDAGEFSVPSKVLTYLCAERPVIGLMPLNNAASRLIYSEANAGLVADDIDSFVENALELLANPRERKEMGNRGRKYAEREFDRVAITQRFADLLNLGPTKVRAEPLNA